MRVELKEILNSMYYFNLKNKNKNKKEKNIRVALKMCKGRL